jgi:hypothetical protein
MMDVQGEGAAYGCARRRARLAGMLLALGQVERAERLARLVLVQVQPAKVSARDRLPGAPARQGQALGDAARWQCAAWHTLCWHRRLTAWGDNPHALPLLAGPRPGRLRSGGRGPGGRAQGAPRLG